MIRAYGIAQLLAALAWLLVLCASVPARAATLSFEAPATCGDGSAVRMQVERLVGQAFDSIERLDFSLQIVVGDDQQYHLQLRTREHADVASERVRELSGATCSEVSEAAAVAIAMAVFGRDAPEAAAAPGPVPVAAANTLPPPAATKTPVDAATWRFTAATAATLDYGALPALGVGATLELGVGYSALRLIVLGSVFSAQDTRLSDTRGGEFNLALAGLLACGERALDSIRLAACAGFELGALRARGLGVDRAHEESTAYRAIRAETGVAYTLVAGLALFARIGVSVPLVRNEFLVDKRDRVHQASSLTGRATLGVELSF